MIDAAAYLCDSVADHEFVAIRLSAVQPQREQVRMGVVMAKFLQNIEIGPRELPGGLHQYSIYLEDRGESDHENARMLPGA